MHASGRVPRVTGAARGGHRLSGRLPGISSVAESSAGNVGALSSAVPLARLDATLSAGTVIRLSGAVPVPAVHRSGRVRGAVPLPSLLASLSIANASTAAYAINLAKSAVTEYTHFDFTHFAHFRGQTFAANGALYRLGGDTDDDDPIAAEFALPPADFGTTRTKRLPYVYVESATDGAMTVSVTADERTVVSANTQTVGRNRRAKLSRGIRAVMWSVKVANIDGEPFAVDALDLLPMMTSRKV